MEKSDRHVSDSRALQLLQEVKEKGKLAQQLREEQARYTHAEEPSMKDILNLGFPLNKGHYIVSLYL